MSRKEIYLQWIPYTNRWRNCRWRTRGRNSTIGRASALPRNLIPWHPCRSQITSVGSATPLSLDPLHGGWGNGKAEKRRHRKWVSFQRVEWTVWEPPYAGRLLYILKDPVRLRFDLPKFQELPPGTSLRATNRGWRGSLGVVELTNKKTQDKNKLLIKHTMPWRDRASSQVTSHAIITRKTRNACARACVCVTHVHIAALMSFVLSCKAFT
jgi:hypothetical protein